MALVPGVRMIGGGAFDHSADVYRPSEGVGTRFREVTKNWARVTPRVRLAVSAKRESRNSSGPGTLIQGEYTGMGAVELDICEGDVLLVTEGPEAPLQVEVDSARRPRGHHLELGLKTWSGSVA